MDRLVSDDDPAFSQEIFDEWSGTPAVAQIEKVVELDGVGNDIGWESVALICTHGQILAIKAV